MASPIISVDGVACPCPSTCEFGWADISSSSAGRVQSGKMYKNLICTKVTIKMSWNGCNRAKTAQLLNLFTRKEYFNVTYEDFTKASGTTTKEFYVGDRTAPLKIFLDNGRHIMETVSFDIIER